MDTEPSLTVALDWGGVSQSMLDRCNLAGLENLLLAALIEDGFAVVADTGQQQATLTLRTTSDGLAIDASHQAATEHRQIAIGRACDSTIAIEIVSVARSALHAVVSAASAQAEPVTPPAPAPMSPPIVIMPVTPVNTRPLWHVGVAAGTVAVAVDEIAPTLRVEVARDLPGQLVGAAVVGASAWHALGLWIIEPTIGAQLRRRMPLGGGWQLAAGASADLLMHVYKYRDAPGGAVLNGRAGIPLELTFPHVPLALVIVPYARFRPIRHRVFDQVAFHSEWFAVDAVLKWVFE